MSSSFTWLSDHSEIGNCSSAEEEAVTPCSSTDDSVADHHISCESSNDSSAAALGRTDEQESGIGTASPPLHRYSKCKYNYLHFINLALIINNIHNAI